MTYFEKKTTKTLNILDIHTRTHNTNMFILVYNGVCSPILYRIVLCTYSHAHVYIMVVFIGVCSTIIVEDCVVQKLTQTLIIFGL